MEKIKELKGKKIAIIGLGASQIDYVIGVENSMQWDEVWCINSAISVFDCDRAFILDPMERFLDSDDAGAQTDVMRRVLPAFDKPIYSCGLDERVPAVVEYPLHEVMQEFKTAYFNTTVAFTVAFALWSEVDQIDLFGIDFSYRNNLHFAEAGRACVEFWLSKCISAGIKVGVSPRSSLLDYNVEPHERLYGYHRLEDPLVALSSEDDEWLICPRSQTEEMIKKYNIKMAELPRAPEPYKG